MCAPFPTGLEMAFAYLYRQISQLKPSAKPDQCRKDLTYSMDEFVKEKIIGAHKVIIQFSLEVMEKEGEVIMTYE